MQTLIFISIALSLYAIHVARNAHLRIDKPPRSFHFTLSEVNENNYENAESVLDDAKIKFYILYLSGSRVFFDEDTFKNININQKIDTFAKLGDKKQIHCRSWGDALRIRYITDQDSDRAEQGEELLLDLLSLPKSSNNVLRENKNFELIKKYLTESGWEIKNRSLSFDDLWFSKGNFEIYITYIS